MTVQEINAAIRRDKPVIAIWTFGDIPHQTRIIRARTRAGITQVKPIGEYRWATLISNAVWIA
jgi:hypothetical protein